MPTYTTTSDLTDEDSLSSSSSSSSLDGQNEVLDQSEDMIMMKNAGGAIDSCNINIINNNNDDVQMQICDLFTDPYTSIPSLVQGTSRLVPALLGLNEQEGDDDVGGGGRSIPKLDYDEEDSSYFRAKITINHQDDDNDNNSKGSTNSNNNTTTSSTTTASEAVNVSPTALAYHHHHQKQSGDRSHHHHHHRHLPKLPMVSDNTVDRLRQIFISQDIPYPQEEMMMKKSNLNGDHDQDSRWSSTFSSCGCCCSNTGIMGKIEVYKYDVFGRSHHHRWQQQQQKQHQHGRHHQHQEHKDDQPTAQQINRLRHLAERLGKAIVNRRKQQQLQQELLMVKETNRRLVESQNLAQIGQWELDLTTIDSGESNSLYWSDAIYDIFRIPKSEFGASYEAFLDAVHPDDRQYVDESYTNSLKTKQPYDIIHRLLFKRNKGASSTSQDTDIGHEEDEGEVRWVREICRTEYDGDTPLYSVGVVQDVTDSKLVKDQTSLDHSETTTITAATTATTTTAGWPSPDQLGTTRKEAVQEEVSCPDVVLGCLNKILTNADGMASEIDKNYYAAVIGGNGTSNQKSSLRRYGQKLDAIKSSCMDAIKKIHGSSNNNCGNNNLMMSNAPQVYIEHGDEQKEEENDVQVDQRRMRLQHQQTIMVAHYQQESRKDWQYQQQQKQQQSQKPVTHHNRPRRHQSCPARQGQQLQQRCRSLSSSTSSNVLWSKCA
jgi:PAS domain-containing protein